MGSRDRIACTDPPSYRSPISTDRTPWGAKRRLATFQEVGAWGGAITTESSFSTRLRGTSRLLGLLVRKTSSNLLSTPIRGACGPGSRRAQQVQGGCEESRRTGRGSRILQSSLTRRLSPRCLRSESRAAKNIATKGDIVDGQWICSSRQAAGATSPVVKAMGCPGRGRCAFDKIDRRAD